MHRIGISFQVWVSLTHQVKHFIYDTGSALGMKIETPEGFSLFGEPLYNPVSYPDPEHKQLVKFNKAYAEWEEDPGDREKILWLGRQHAYVGRSISLRDSKDATIKSPFEMHTVDNNI